MEQPTVFVNEFDETFCESCRIPEYDDMQLSRFLELNSMSLRELARRCGTSASTMVRVRDQSVVPSRRVLEAICRETGGAVTVGELIQIGGSASVVSSTVVPSLGATSAHTGDPDYGKTRMVRDERNSGGTT
jgi:hypothetical protein